MQVLKEEMRKRIFEAALEEFSQKGYAQASMREISKKADMTVGNLYRYFKDKEALFYSVISPAYHSLMELVQQCIMHVDKGFDASFFEFLSQQILKICREHKIELLIIFDGSEGTIYEKAKEEMMLVVEDFLKEYMLAGLRDRGAEIKDAYLLKVIAAGFVDGMTMIARKYDSAEELQKVAAQFIAFYFSDVLKRFG